MHLLNRNAISALFLAVAAMPATCAAQSNDDVLGRWRITKVLESSEVGALTDDGAARLVGKIVTIQPDKMTFAGEVCNDPDLERHYENTVRYIREDDYAPAGKLGLPEVVTVINLGCTEAFIKGYDKIVILWKGFFFDAVRIGN